MRRPHLNQLALGFLILLLSGCAHLPFSGKQPTPAKTAMESGHYAKAARLYLQLAKKASGPEKQHDLVLAAQAAWQANEKELAQETLVRIFPSMLSAVDRARADLVQARLHLAHDRPADAIKFLAIPPRKTPSSLARIILEMRGETLFKLDQPLAALKTLDLRANMLSGKALQTNNTMIWKGLQASRLPARDNPALQQAGEITRGWVALARIERQSWGSHKALEKALSQWQEHYPHHPATQRIAPQVLKSYEQRYRYPKQLALLLPLSGRLQAPSRAILEGFLAGRFQSKGKTLPTLSVYDTGKAGKNAVQAYKKAARGGADVIIGPLTKDAVTAVAGVADHGPPVLTLNFPHQGSFKQPPSAFYRMGLSPKDGVRAAVRAAARAGLHRAVVLAPDTQWGHKAVQALDESLNANGGALVGKSYFPPDTTTFSDQIKQLLGLKAAKKRHDELVGTLRRQLDFTPRPRDDADFLFIAGQPRSARLIRPQLKFFHAGNMPVYATSSVYTGSPDPKADRDEDSIVFCDAPWILNPNKQSRALRHKFKQFWPQAFSHYPRLFALGLDAYRLVPAVHARALAPDKHFQGVTGSLYNGGSGRILRDLPCAQFRHGKAALLSSAAGGQEGQ